MAIGRTNALSGGVLEIGDVTQDVRYSTDPNFVKCSGQSLFCKPLDYTLKPTDITLSFTIRNAIFDQTVLGFASDGKIYVAISYSGRIATSTDLVNWTTRNAGFETANLNAIKYANGIFVAVGSAGKISTSTDGINWTCQAVSKNSLLNTLNAVHYANGLWVTAGNGYAVFWSEDGYSWTECKVPGLNPNECDCSSLTYYDGMWWGTLLMDNLIRSSDGKTWTSDLCGVPNGIVAEKRTIASITAIGGDRKLLLYRKNGKVYYNSNFREYNKWTPAGLSFEDYDGMYVHCADGLCLCYGPSKPKSYFYTLDGAKWTEVTYPFATGYFSSVQFVNGQWMIGLSDKRFVTSPSVKSLQMPNYFTPAYIKIK